MVQNRRHATSLRDRAEKLAAEKDAEKQDEAIKLYDQYLKYQPKDDAAFRKFAELNFRRSKDDPKQSYTTVENVEKFLRQFPENPPERKKLIDLYLDLGRLESARQHIRILFDKGEQYRQDVDLLDKAATCEVGLGGDMLQAVKFLDEAIQTKKAPPRLVARLLGILNDIKAFNDQRFTPSKYVEILVKDDPYRTDVEARVTAGRFLLVTNDLVNARRHITDALAMSGGATHPEALMAAAELERAEIKSADTVIPQLKKSRAFLETAFNLDKKNARAGIMLAGTLTDLGEPKAAVDVLRQAAQALGDDSPDLRNVLIDRLIDLDERELSAQLIEKIAKNEADRDRMVKYFRGRMEILKRDYTTARLMLDEVAPTLARIPTFHKKAMNGLGLCYAAIQNPDKQLECFAAALKDDGYFLPARIGIADAFLKLGRYAEALAEYKALVNGYGLTTYRSQLARLELKATLAQPGKRNWDAFEAALGPVPERTPELDILMAESLLNRDPPDPEKAKTLIEGALAKEPRNVNAWLTLARLFSRGNAPEADKFLDQMDKQLGDTVDVRLARSVVHVNRTRLPNPQDFKKLATGAEKYEKEERRRLFLGLSEASTRAALLVNDAEAKNLRDLAIDFLRSAAELDPADLLSRAALVDLAIIMDRRDVRDEALSQIAKIEGEKGPIGLLARAIVKLPEIRRMEDKGARAGSIAALRDSLRQVKELRPGWPRLYVVMAQLDEMEGLTDAALANYTEAITKGERQEFPIRRAVELYRDKHEEDRAFILLNKLYTEMNLPDDLERFRAIKDLLARDIPKSERPTIDRVAPAESKDWRILLLRGSLLAAISADDDAQVAFRRAVEFGDVAPETWGALIGHLVRIGRVEDAKRATAQAESKLADPKTPSAKAELLIVIAGCHEIIGNAKRADELYREALKTAPRDLEPNRQLIHYLQRSGRLPEAEKMLDGLVDAPEGNLSRWARRRLALTYMGRPREAYQLRDRALSLVERNLSGGVSDLDDVKARAVIQTVDPATKELGMKTLADRAKYGELTPDEFLLMGRLNFEQGKVFESVDYYEQAARPRAGLTPDHLANLVRVYTRVNQLSKAHQALERLKILAPRSWDATREEARLRKAEAIDAEKRNAPDDVAKFNTLARELILNFPDGREEKNVRLRTGPLFEELGFLAEAETYYNRILTEGKDPFPHYPLAMFLIRQKRTVEAIALAKKYEASTPPVLTAVLLSGAIRSRSPGPAAERDVAAWLEAKLQKPADTYESVALHKSRAELFDGIGEYDRAISEYEQALLLARPAKAETLRDFDPALIANNLAMLVALYRPQDVDKSIKWMDEVIAIRGPAPVFLDTRAVAYLVKGGKTDEAARDLNLALIQQRRAVYLFHLAWAYDLNPDKRALRDQTLEEARKLGITPEDLHPMEARKFNELFRKK